MSREWARRAVDVDGHRVMTFTLGEGPRTVLLVHGGPGCPSRYLRDSHEALADQGLRLITWDQLGCGESDHPAEPSLWTLDRFVAELETVRAALGLDEIDLLGQSWGESSAWNTCCAIPTGSGPSSPPTPLSIWPECNADSTGRSRRWATRPPR